MTVTTQAEEAETPEDGRPGWQKVQVLYTEPGSNLTLVLKPHKWTPLEPTPQESLQTPLDLSDAPMEPLETPLETFGFVSGSTGAAPGSTGGTLNSFPALSLNVDFVVKV